MNQPIEERLGELPTSLGFRAESPVANLMQEGERRQQNQNRRNQLLTRGAIGVVAIVAFGGAVVLTQRPQRVETSAPIAQGQPSVDEPPAQGQPPVDEPLEQQADLTTTVVDPVTVTVEPPFPTVPTSALPEQLTDSQAEQPTESSATTFLLPSAPPLLPPSAPPYPPDGAALPSEPPVSGPNTSPGPTFPSTGQSTVELVDDRGGRFVMRGRSLVYLPTEGAPVVVLDAGSWAAADGIREYNLFDAGRIEDGYYALVGEYRHNANGAQMTTLLAIDLESGQQSVVAESPWTTGGPAEHGLMQAKITASMIRVLRTLSGTSCVYTQLLTLNGKLVDGTDEPIPAPSWVDDVPLNYGNGPRPLGPCTDINTWRDSGGRALLGSNLDAEGLRSLNEALLPGSGIFDL